VKQLYPDLWQTPPEHPFDGMSTHAYLLTRSTGNVLFYNSGCQDEYDQIRQLGGIAFQFLSHRDEAGKNLKQLKDLFHNKLCCHKLEESAIAKASPVDLIFETRGVYAGDIEVIPTPGHTDGSTCFMYKSPHGKTYLFTGDTIFPDRDSWGTYVSSSQKPVLARSLELLKSLNPDVVISSGSVGQFSLHQMSPGQWSDVLNDVIRTLV
jgi:glyoxylase-like metal-dependent hydrolase (beta-lactamase superfamily II)